jgi:hypothetical protein
MQVVEVEVEVIRELVVCQQLVLVVQELAVKVLGIKNQVMQMTLEEVLELQTVVLVVVVAEIIVLPLVWLEALVVLEL